MHSLSVCFTAFYYQPLYVDAWRWMLQQLLFTVQSISYMHVQAERMVGSATSGSWAGQRARASRTLKTRRAPLRPQAPLMCPAALMAAVATCSLAALVISCSVRHPSRASVVGFIVSVVARMPLYDMPGDIYDAGKQILRHGAPSCRSLSLESGFDAAATC